MYNCTTCTSFNLVCTSLYNIGNRRLFTPAPVLISRFWGLSWIGLGLTPVGRWGWLCGLQYREDYISQYGGYISSYSIVLLYKVASSLIFSFLKGLFENRCSALIGGALCAIHPYAICNGNPSTIHDSGLLRFNLRGSTTQAPLLSSAKKRGPFPCNLRSRLQSSHFHDTNTTQKDLRNGGAV